MKKILPVLLVLTVLALGTFLLRDKPPESNSEAIPLASRAQSVETPRASASVSDIAQPTPNFTQEEKVAESAFNNIHDLLKDQRLGVALDALKEILKKEPNNEHALLELGLLLAEQKGMEGKAIYFLEKTLATNPNNDQAVGELLRLSEERGDSVHEALSKAYESNPESTNLAAGLGKTSLDRGDYQKAISLLEKSTQDPQLAESSYNSLVESYKSAGDQAKVAETLERKMAWQAKQIAQAKSGNQDYNFLEQEALQDQLALAYAYFSNRRYREAEGLAKQVLGKIPGHPPAVDLLNKIAKIGG